MTPLASILLVDDDPIDVEFALLALEARGLHERVSVARDGQDALDFLRREGRHARRPPELPRLVLLDVNMPRVDGWQVLDSIKSTPAWRSVCVVMLTTSTRPEDRARCAAADAFLVKPLDVERFVELLGDLVKRLLKTGCRS